jgi:ribosomal protein S18 acetylase RimI-like enzyme
VRFPGCGTFDPHASFLVVHRRLRALIGLILCSQVRADVGHVTQVCILPEYRSAGLGVALLAATTQSLRERGFKAISLTVTQANDRAIALYQRIGYESQRVFDAFVWEG